MTPLSLVLAIFFGFDFPNGNEKIADRSAKEWNADLYSRNPATRYWAFLAIKAMGTRGSIAVPSLLDGEFIPRHGAFSPTK